MELTNPFKEIEDLAKRINATVEDTDDGLGNEERFPDWDTCFRTRADDEHLWAEIEIDNAIMEMESNYI